MREIKDTINIKHVVSEPGDCTRYDYVLMPYGDEYIISPYMSTFPFPRRLHWFLIKDISTVEQCAEFIELNKDRYDNNLKDVNPNTLFEVINAIKELRNEEELANICGDEIN